jgi:hypothetical protein
MKELCAKADISNFKVAVDFDGTMVHHPGKQNVEDYEYMEYEPVPYALEWLRIFMKMDIGIILWTSRGLQSFQNRAVEYMTENDIELYGVNNNEDQKSWSDSAKVHAHVYVDDNGLVPLTYPIPGRRGVVDWQIVGHMVLDRFFNRERYYC